METELLEVPPTTVAVDKNILEYMQGADNGTLQALLNNGGHPILQADGSVHGDFCHSVAAAQFLRLRTVRVYLEYGTGN